MAEIKGQQQQYQQIATVCLYSYIGSSNDTRCQYSGKLCCDSVCPLIDNTLWRRELQEANKRL